MKDENRKIYNIIHGLYNNNNEQEKIHKLINEEFTGTPDLHKIETDIFVKVKN